MTYVHSEAAKIALKRRGFSIGRIMRNWVSHSDGRPLLMFSGGIHSVLNCPGRARHRLKVGIKTAFSFIQPFLEKPSSLLSGSDLNAIFQRVYLPERRAGIFCGRSPGDH